MEQFFSESSLRTTLFHVMHLLWFPASAAREASLGVPLLYSMRGRMAFSAVSSSWHTLTLQNYTAKRYAATNICSNLKDQISQFYRDCLSI